MRHRNTARDVSGESDRTPSHHAADACTFLSLGAARPSNSVLEYHLRCSYYGGSLDISTVVTVGMTAVLQVERFNLIGQFEGQDCEFRGKFLY